MGEEKRYTEQEAHAHFARSLNGEVWALLGQAERTPEESERMVHAAHASLYHWLSVGSGVNQQRGEWLIARVYSELGLGEAALRHAQRCQELTEQHAGHMEDFDRAYAYEALARANAVAGNREAALQDRQQARAAGDAIADQESKAYFDADLAGGNWGLLL
jgi:hypothetical protein